MDDADPSPDGSKYSEGLFLSTENHGNNSEELTANTDWDGSESELIFDEDTETYEDNMTGIKLSYKLGKEDIYEFIKNSAPYEKKKTEKNKHTALQAVMFIMLIVLAVITRNNLYTFVSLIPFLTGVSLWIIPHLSMKNLVNSIYDGREYAVEIFPNKIEVLHAGLTKEFPLDESGKCEIITDKLILVYSKAKEPLIIPIRAIKPDCLPDIQAMIVAGARPI
ncbi:MAG: hypothetical protein LBR79_05185 [Oscillospiraceae bacterium]|jgi:hypothetical protein|nr:hypothetical protein [Oscillospiraceae bacterium]